MKNLFKILLNNIILFTAILGACMTVAYTYFISKSFYIGMAIMAFSISMTSSFHVKRIANGTIKTRLLYSIGATIGCVIGLFISRKILGTLT